MSRLTKLLRLRKWELDETRRGVALLEGRRVELEETIDKLAKDLLAEAEIAKESLEGAAAYTAFIEAVRQKQAALRVSIGALDNELEAARAVNAVAFREWKSVEILHDRQTSQEQVEQSRRDQLEIEELARNRRGAR